MCGGKPHRLDAFDVAEYQPLFSDKIVQMLFGSFGGALAQLLKVAATSNSSNCLKTPLKLLICHYTDA